MLNSTSWAYATCFVGKVYGPLWSTWGAPLREGKSGVKAKIVNTKVACRVRAGQTPPPRQATQTGARGLLSGRLVPYMGWGGGGLSPEFLRGGWLCGFPPMLPKVQAPAPPPRSAFLGGWVGGLLSCCFMEFLCAFVCLWHAVLVHERTIFHEVHSEAGDKDVHSGNRTGVIQQHTPRVHLSINPSADVNPTPCPWSWGASGTESHGHGTSRCRRPSCCWRCRRSALPLDRGRPFPGRHLLGEHHRHHHRLRGRDAQDIRGPCLRLRVHLRGCVRGPACACAATITERRPVAQNRWCCCCGGLGMATDVAQQTCHRKFSNMSTSTHKGGGGRWHKALVVGSVGLWRRLLASRP